MKKTYGINEFPEDGRFWRVVHFGGINGNPRVDSEPLVEVLLAAISNPERGSLQTEAAKADETRCVRIGVGQLPYVSIGSIWHNRRPVRLSNWAGLPIDISVDTTKTRFVSFGDLATVHRVIPKSLYTLGKSFPVAATTQFIAIEANDDPWAVLVPVIEIIRFYYASSTRLSQAFFWGELSRSINSEKSGRLDNDLFRVHLRKWMYDSDAWTLARFHASDLMQQQANNCFGDIQKHRINTFSATSTPCREFRCGFPFAGATTLSGVPFALPGPNVDRFFFLKLLRCSAPFPFNGVVCDRDNRNVQDRGALGIDLPQAWRKRIANEDDIEKMCNETQSPDNFHSDGEPTNAIEPLVVDVCEDRFSYLAGKVLRKDEEIRQQYRGSTPVRASPPNLTGLGTGGGTSGNSDRMPTVVNVTRPEDAGKPNHSKPPVSMQTFFEAISVLARNPEFAVRYIAKVASEVDLTEKPATVNFPTSDPANRRKRFAWSKHIVSTKEWRPRRVAVVCIKINALNCYVVEAERLKESDTLSVLVFARGDYQALRGNELNSILLCSAGKGRWMSAEEMLGYRRTTTTHQGLSGVDVLARRIEVKVRELAQEYSRDEEKDGAAETTTLKHIA